MLVVAKIFANTMLVIFLIASVLMWIKGEQGLLSLIIGNIVFFNVFRIPYYVVKGYKEKSDPPQPIASGIDPFPKA